MSANVSAYSGGLFDKQLLSGELADIEAGIVINMEGGKGGWGN